MSKFSKLAVFQNIKKLNESFSDEIIEDLICTSSLLIAVAAQDKKLVQKELEAIFSFLSNKLSLEREAAMQVFKVIFKDFKEKKTLASNLGFFASHLNQRLAEKDRKYFLSALLMVARADRVISENEKDLIKKIVKRLELSEDFYSEQLLEASLKITQEVFDEIKSGHG